VVDIPHGIVEECGNIPRIFLQTIMSQKKEVLLIRIDFNANLDPDPDDHNL
jgi:hypothetical protein